VFFVWSRFSLPGLHQLARTWTQGITNIPDRSFEMLGSGPHAKCGILLNHYEQQANPRGGVIAVGQ